MRWIPSLLHCRRTRSLPDPAGRGAWGRTGAGNRHPLTPSPSHPLTLSALILALAAPAAAQKAPETGYVYPPGGRAGTTVEVHLGGYDWTPDMQFFVHHPRVRLETRGSLTPIFVPPPPYWFGPKSFSTALPIPRELPARLTLPADLPPGPLLWQVANANGGSAAGVFWVAAGPQAPEVPEVPEVQEESPRREPQPLPALPVTVNGRVSRIAEVDRYRLSVPKAGPVTCELFARRLGSGFHGVLAVRDSAGRLVIDAADTEGRDVSLTFAARAGEEYVVSVHDVDFNGDRAFVYRLEVTPGPRVLAALPAAGRRGETRPVEFRGIGVASGAARLESVVRQVTFPAEPDAATLPYRLETEHGTAPPFPLLVSDLPESVAPPIRASARTREGGPRPLRIPGAVTGLLAQGAADRYTCELKQGESVSLEAQARRLGSSLDVTLAVIGPDGKELARSDDLPGTTDAGLEFTAPADGLYTFSVSGAVSGDERAPVYRLAAVRAEPDFRLEAAPRLDVLLGGKAELTVKAARRGGFGGPIALKFDGLPEGISAPADAAIPAGGQEVKVPLQAAADAPALAATATVTGTATIDGKTVTRVAAVPAGGSLAPSCPEEVALPRVLVSGIMKPKWKVTPVDREGGRTVHRGTTYPAEVIVERTDGFEGPLELQMAARQARHRMGITGPDLPVAPGVERIAYPCFMPEWLETSRTSRMILIAVGKLADPRGNVRTLVAPADGRITMSMEGALLKVSHEAGEMSVRPGEEFEVPVRIARSPKLPEAVRLELRLPEELEGADGMLRAEPVLLPPGRDEARFRIAAAADPRLRGDVTVTIRAVAVQAPGLPVVSETAVTLHFPE
jgi:hypothetical protein